MYNIIRSVNFSTRRSMVVVLTVFSMITAPVLLPLLLGAPLKEITADLYFTQLMEYLCVLWVFGIMILSACVSSGDAGDRTVNYEIMAGRGRGRIFAARTLNGILWGALLAAFLLFLPMLYYGLLNGWPLAGLKPSDILLRILLSLLPTPAILPF